MAGPYDRGGWDGPGSWPQEHGGAGDNDGGRRQGPQGYGGSPGRFGGPPSGDPSGSGGRGSWADSSGGSGVQRYTRDSYGRDPYGRDPYGRPASPSGRYGADDPTRPSSDWSGRGSGYGQAGPLSQGRAGDGGPPGAATWGEYTESNTYWRGGQGPYGYRNQAPEGPEWESMPRKQYGVPWEPAQRWDMTPPRPPRKSRRKLWVTLGIIAGLLLVTCSGIGFVIAQFFAPAYQVGLFCGSMQAQRYGASYAMLSAELHGELTSSDFAVDGQTLDAIEGSVSKCGTDSGAHSYAYSLGASAATVAVYFTRATAGTLRGNIYLKNENGWKVDRMDASLLGVDLGALQAANAYCEDMRGGSYASAYGLLGASLKAHTAAADYAQLGVWHDTVDGPVSACSVVGLGTGSGDASSSVTLSITRGKLGAKKDTLSLDVEGGVWRVSAVGPALQGTDLGAVQTAARFCADVKSANYSDAYGLLTDNVKSGGTEADLAAVFSGVANGVKWDSCAPDVSTFKLSGHSATLTVTITVTNVSTNQTRSGPVKFSFVAGSNGWLLDDMQNQ